MYGSPLGAPRRGHPEGSGPSSTTGVHLVPRLPSSVGRAGFGSDDGSMWTTALATFISAAFATVIAAGTPGWVAPVESGLSNLLRPFERPADRFAPGHRGIDLAASPATPVQAIGSGRVSFVGDVAGVPTVSVEHPPSLLLSTYQPVTGSVEVGDQVTAGGVIGQLASDVSGTVGHCSSPCLHLGLRRQLWQALDATSDPYLDPRAWILREPVLKPLVP